MTKDQRFTVPEAAFITGQPVKSINRLFDDGPVDSTKSRKKPGLPVRTLRECDLVFVLATCEEPLSHLDQSGRQRVYRRIVEYWERNDRKPERLQLSDVLELHLGKLNDLVNARASELTHVQEMVSIDPEIRGGEPVIRGTRVPVYVIHDLLKEGATTTEILESYPSLDEETVRAADVYASAYPRKGRPPRLPWRNQSS